MDNSEEPGKQPDPGSIGSTGIQFVSVRVTMEERFSFPSKCVICGEPAAEGLFHKVSLQRQNPNLFTPGGWYEIEFPICAECDQLVKFSRRKSRAGCLPAGLFGLATATAIYVFTKNPLPALMTGAIDTIIGWVVFSWISDRRIPKDKMDWYRKFVLAVKITALHPDKNPDDARVDIRFLSEDYARQFATLNKGEII